MSLILLVCLPFLGALLPGMAQRAGRGVQALSAGLATATALAGLVSLAPAILRGETVAQRVDWLPQLGLAFSLRLDGLGLLFAGLILGIGLLVILYARFYLVPRDPMGQFYSYLLLFQGAMLGIVLSDNILLLLVFWELTSLSSFLLIGFWSHLAEGRRGARMALTVTGAGGLALIAGALLLGRMAGSFELSVILTKADVIQASPYYLPALILILLGAFAKSAQVPFQFWLPQAMAAPTPVSAYLHSATMVKAGIFLMARLWPVLAGTDAWFAIVTTAGLLTLLVGAWTALFKDDLKALLAYSTVSHLGFITLLLGLGTKPALLAAIFHIVNHASFKAALFLSAGIVDHEAGTRSLSRLGGLSRLMPVAFVLAGLAALSMAGVPPLNGFLSKEMLLEEASHTGFAGSPWLLAALVTLGAAVSAAYSFRLIGAVYLGPVREDYPHRPHDPTLGMSGPVMVLVALVLAIGLAPMLVAGGLVQVASGASAGGPVEVAIKLWHGLEPAALWLSLAALGGGLAIWGAFPRLAALDRVMHLPDSAAIFEAGTTAAVRLARTTTQTLHDGPLSRGLGLALATMAAVSVWAFATGSHLPGTRPPTPVEFAPAVVLAGLVLATLGALWLHRSRLLALLLVGVVGLVLSLGFAYLSAPDLALTQITVEVVTVLLMLLALNLLPKSAPLESLSRRMRDALFAGGLGLGMAALAYAMLTRSAAFEPISTFHLAQSKPGAGGNNAVNTIIVDFRGFDTYGEIIVLGVAALIIGAVGQALRGLSPTPAPASADAHPVIFATAARLLLPVGLLVGIYIYLRGHNLPGGGFVAGLVVAIALMLQYLASGHGWTRARLRVGFFSLIGAGVVAATLTGLGAWLWGKPFLTSWHGYVTLPGLEKFELASAMGFDLGVFLCVLGAVLATLSSVARLTEGGGR